MSDSDIETPPLKSRKVTMANHATIARRTKSDLQKQRTSEARKTRRCNESLQNVTQACRRNVKPQQNNNFQHVSNICGDLQTLLDEINCKFEEYAELDEIEPKIMYVYVR